MIKRLKQVYSKFIFCLRISAGIKTFFLLVVNSKRFNRFQKLHTATNLQNQAEPVQYDIIYAHTRNKFFFRTYAGDIRMFYEIFWEQVYWLPASFFVNGIIIDAGANIGMAALYFSFRYPGATIFCIEPAVENIHLLKMNLAHAVKYGKVHVVQAALYEKNGEISMGTFLEKNKLEKIDLLKIDIEGAEKFIFSSHREWLPKVKAILIEIHSQQMKEDIQVILLNAGFYCCSWHRTASSGNVFFASR